MNLNFNTTQYQVGRDSEPEPFAVNFGFEVTLQTNLILN